MLHDAQRLVVLAFKRLHLRQQSNERREVKATKIRCSKVTITTDGKQQLSGAFYSDSMTEATGSSQSNDRGANLAIKIQRIAMERFSVDFCYAGA